MSMRKYNSPKDLTKMGAQGVYTPLYEGTFRWPKGPVKLVEGF